ncbi:MAG: membrane protein insertion efficiency factor YidD [Actinobacteria bacterium]|nr:membrane protein insertion efficiency factor YidD [Actinomycetota bacterium]
MTGPHCRFVPSCSEYALMVLEEFGLTRGGWLATKRLCRCHPFSPGGMDPAPRRTTGRTEP